MFVMLHEIIDSEGSEQSAPMLLPFGMRQNIPEKVEKIQADVYKKIHSRYVMAHKRWCRSEMKEVKIRSMVFSFLVKLYVRHFLSFLLVKYKRGSICPSLACERCP